MGKGAFFVSAILLAAGGSKRMGRPKLELPFGDSTILEQTVGNLLNSKVDELIVVLGYRAEELASRIAKYPLKIVVNPHYERGMSTSIIAGLNGIHPMAEAVMIALADQPLVDYKLIHMLMAEFQESGKGIVIPLYRGKRGHPVIFSIKYKAEFLQLTGDTGGRQIINDHPDDVLEVSVDSDSVIIDIDAWNDYAQLT